MVDCPQLNFNITGGGRDSVTRTRQRTASNLARLTRLKAYEGLNEIRRTPTHRGRKEKKMEKTLMHNGRWNGIDVTKYEPDAVGMKKNELTYRMVADSLSSMILCNDITKLFYSTINGEYVEPELVSGCDYDEDTEEYTEFFQYYIIGGSEWDKTALSRINETVYYIEPLDLYIWAIDHYGTAWSGVGTGYELVEAETFEEYMNDFYQEERY